MTENTSHLMSNTGWLFLAGVLQKIFMFSVNQLSLASSTPEVIGQASIQLELWLSTSLFLSREGIRIACLRFNPKSSNEMAYLINLSWLPFIIVLVTSTILITFKTVSELFFLKDYTFRSMVSYLCYSLAASIECLGEPWYNLICHQADLRPKIKAETSALFVKSISNLYFITVLDLGLLSFGLSQLLYSIVYLLVLVTSSVNKRNGSNYPSTMFPSKVKNENNSSVYFDKDLVSNALSLFSTSVVKHILTEADKIALTVSCSHNDQGIYAITNNYGSLIARILYLPLEDSSRLSFSRSSTGNSVESKQLLLRLLRLVFIIGMAIAFFGPSFVSLFTNILLKAQWRSKTMVETLTYYCYYLLLLGINGISEAFIQSVAPSKDFWTINRGLIVSSLTFFLTAVSLVSSHGATGIIIANITAMVVRIGFSFYYIQSINSTFQKFLSDMIQALPPNWWWVSLFVLKLLLTASERYILNPNHRISNLYHLIVGIISGIVYVCTAFFTLQPIERTHILNLLRGKRFSSFLAAKDTKSK